MSTTDTKKWNSLHSWRVYPQRSDTAFCAALQPLPEPSSRPQDEAGGDDHGKGCKGNDINNEVQAGPFHDATSRDGLVATEWYSRKRRQGARGKRTSAHLILREGHPARLVSPAPFAIADYASDSRHHWA